MMSSIPVYTGFEIYSSEEGWTRPNIEPIIERVEDKFKDRCIEVTLMAYRSRHFVAHLRLRSGKAYVARVEFSFMAAMPWRAVTTPWTLESEVATMVYLKKNTPIPIPSIYMHDNDANGVVGGPWMVMDYVPGLTLHDAWPSMSSQQRKKACLSMADIFSRLFSLRFDSIGSLYFMDAARGHIKVGPIAILPSSRLGDVSPPPRHKCGPYSNTTQWLLALAHDDTCYVNTRYPLTQSELDNHAASLQILEKNFPFFRASNDILLSSIIIRPVDLHPYNVMVSHDDPSKIISIIDWEGTQTNPIWNVVPRFLEIDPYNPDGLEAEKEVLEAFLWDEVARRSPLWAKGRARGQALRDLARRAESSSAKPANMNLPEDIDLMTAS